MTLEIKETPGKCRWCGCTEDNACVGGCGWANRAQTLCTECTDIDRLVRTARGRVRLTDAWHTAPAPADLK